MKHVWPHEPVKMTTSQLKGFCELYAAGRIDSHRDLPSYAMIGIRQGASRDYAAEFRARWPLWEALLAASGPPPASYASRIGLFWARSDEKGAMGPAGLPSVMHSDDWRSALAAIGTWED